MTDTQSTGYHYIVKISGGPKTFGAFFLEEGTFELSLKDTRIGQDEKGQNKCFPGRENSTC